MKRLPFISMVLLVICACEAGKASTQTIVPTPSSLPGVTNSAVTERIMTASPSPQPASLKPAPTSSRPDLKDGGQQLGYAHSWDVAFGDVERDGDLDAFIANSIQGSAGSMVWLNDGLGFFTVIEQDLGYGQGVSLGDLDRDGDLDIFLTHGETWRESGGEIPNEVWINETIIK